MSQDPQQRRCATRRCVLLGAGLAGIAGAVTACSTASVPYDANEAGTAVITGADSGQVPVSPSAAPHAAASPGMPSAANPGASTMNGTVLGPATGIPVGGGTVFTADKVVVTQPAKGTFEAFSAVCTHSGCLCDKVAAGTIDCPCHGAKFSITTGAPVAGPARSSLRKKKIAVANGEIVLLA